jgi:DNA-binding transcriptional regulator YiaG
MASTTEQAVTLALLRRLVADGTAKQLRERARLSLADVARAVGADASSVLMWERGRQQRAPAALRYAELIAALAEIAPAP